jgi:hypothetical protein
MPKDEVRTGSEKERNSIYSDEDEYKPSTSPNSLADQSFELSDMNPIEKQAEEQKRVQNPEFQPEKDNLIKETRGEFDEERENSVQQGGGKKRLSLDPFAKPKKYEVENLLKDWRASEDEHNKEVHGE